MKSDVYLLAMVKEGERYMFVFDDASRADTLRTFGRFASDPELSFSWYDAAVLSQWMRSGDYTTPGRFTFPTQS